MRFEYIIFIMFELHFFSELISFFNEMLQSGFQIPFNLVHIMTQKIDFEI